MSLEEKPTPIPSNESGNDNALSSPTLIQKEEKKVKVTYWQNIIFLIIIILSWSTPNVIGRYLSVNSELNPIQISTLRYFPAALVLVIFCLLSKRGKTLFQDLKTKYYHLLIAAIILTTFVLLQMYSVSMTSASASSFLLNVNPVITFILSIIILKERHKWWGSIGVFIATAGIFFVAVPIKNISDIFAKDLLLGNTLAFLSGCMWAIYSVYLKKFLKERDPITTTTWTLTFSSIFLIIAMFIVEGWFQPLPKYYHVILTVFMGIVPTAIAFTLWLETIKRITVQKASVFQFLIPIIATLFALAMGETIDIFFGIGAALILIGLIITEKS